MSPAELRDLLPEVMRRAAPPGSPLAALLAGMAALHAPTEALLADLAAQFAPYTAPAPLLPMLAHWLNLAPLFAPQRAGDVDSSWAARPLPTSAGHLRELLAQSAQVARWRGTERGLLQMLEIATGVSGFRIDPGEADAPAFHLRLWVPGAAAPQLALVERIVAREKPAYVTAAIELATPNTA